MRILSPTLLFFLLVASSCQPEPRNAVPADDTYIYSGTFKAIQEPFIKVEGKTYENELGPANPLQIVAEVNSDNLIFTVYGYEYGIYEANIFVRDTTCLQYNGTEFVSYERDASGNDEVRLIFPEDFWKKCYYDDDIERTASFIIKSENPIFKR